MTREEVRRRCAELNEDATAEAGVRWMAKEVSPGDWQAVRVRIPGARKVGPLHSGQESSPPPDPTDPRPLVNPNWGVG